MTGLTLAPAATAPVIGLTVLAAVLVLAGIAAARWPLWALGLLAAVAAVTVASLSGRSVGSAADGHDRAAAVASGPDGYHGDVEREQMQPFNEYRGT